MTRDIALMNTFNLRDLGGYPTADGRQVRWRRLFRGAGLQRLSGADLEVVRELGLATAIDLRTEGELAATGGYALPATFHHLPMLTTIWDLTSVDPDAPADAYLASRYVEMLDEGAATIAATMRILARPESFPAAFYCAAGKDRTGVLAALVLDAVGVEPEQIVADYHLSKERVERIRARRRRVRRDARPAAAVHAGAGWRDAAAARVDPRGVRIDARLPRAHRRRAPDGRVDRGESARAGSYLSRPARRLVAPERLAAIAGSPSASSPPTISPVITPFTLAVPDADLDDLRARLERTRWPEAETVDDWLQGVPLAYVQELCAYWANEYDWRRVEARLNAIGQFRTEIDGLGIHFLHARSPRPDALPLILTHGWPGSVVEFLKVIGPLTEDFHVVCPSLPGYGFSDKPARAGWGTARIAAAWAELMARLGYERYGAQGGDWGAMVTTRLAECDAQHLAGIHVNMPLVSADDIRAVGAPTEAEQAALDAFASHRRDGTGYSKQQSTRPQTLGYGLVDSPAAQCAWIVEKFRAWTDEHDLTRDELLDNVMLYWLPGTGASSARLYWESFRERDLPPIEVPAGVSVFPREIFPVSRRWVERRFRDLRHYNELDRGGHFAAFEQPELFVDELRATFRGLTA